MQSPYFPSKQSVKIWYEYSSQNVAKCNEIFNRKQYLKKTYVQPKGHIDTFTTIKGTLNTLYRLFVFIN